MRIGFGHVVLVAGVTLCASACSAPSEPIGSGGAGGVDPSTSSLTCEDLSAFEDPCIACTGAKCCDAFAGCGETCFDCTVDYDPDLCDYDDMFAYVEECQRETCGVECGTAAPGYCSRLCCDDGDCGSGVCDKDVGDPFLGVCAYLDPTECDAPAIAPSNGACVTLDGVDRRCNPITNEGCVASACLVFRAGKYECGPLESNAAPLCGACDLINGPLCGLEAVCWSQP